VQHAREDEIVGEKLLADRLGAAVDAPARLADGVEARLGRRGARFLGRVPALASPRRLRAACSIASQICW
jgi:hypothetical protein